MHVPTPTTGVHRPTYVYAQLLKLGCPAQHHYRGVPNYLPTYQGLLKLGTDHLPRLGRPAQHRVHGMPGPTPTNVYMRRCETVWGMCRRLVRRAGAPVSWPWSVYVSVVVAWCFDFRSRIVMLWVVTRFDEAKLVRVYSPTRRNATAFIACWAISPTSRSLRGWS